MNIARLWICVEGKKRKRMNKLIFQSLASGSSGNCYYIGTINRGLLIDAGISARTIKRRLEAIGVTLDSLWGILITHDHADHVRGVGTLAERYQIPVYTTQMVHMGMDRNYGLTPKVGAANRRFVEKMKQFDIADFKVMAFPVPHDSTDCVGYAVEYNGVRFCIATDVGEATQLIQEQIAMADYLVIEANHDKLLLARGPYPQRLKDRIASPRGHLSNDNCANLLAKNLSSRLKHVYLCHLSKENNQPNVAYNTVREILMNNGIEVGKHLQLTVLDRTSASKVYELL